MTYIDSPEAPRQIRKVKIVVGDEWIEHSFGRAANEQIARARLEVMLESLLPKGNRR